MTSLSLEQAQAMLPEIVRQLQSGGEITITGHEQPLPQVRKASHTSWPGKAGSVKGGILRIAPHLDAPLDESREYME